MVHNTNYQRQKAPTMKRQRSVEENKKEDNNATTEAVLDLVMNVCKHYKRTGYKFELDHERGCNWVVRDVKHRVVMLSKVKRHNNDPNLVQFRLRDILQTEGLFSMSTNIHLDPKIIMGGRPAYDYSEPREQSTILTLDPRPYYNDFRANELVCHLPSDVVGIVMQYIENTVVKKMTWGERRKFRAVKRLHFSKR